MRSPCEPSHTRRGAARHSRGSTNRNGYVPIAIAFGILARQAGLRTGKALAMSAIVYAGASQFASLPLIAGGASPIAIALATLALNSLPISMSASLVQKLPFTPLQHSALASPTRPSWWPWPRSGRRSCTSWAHLARVSFWSTGRPWGAVFSTLIPQVLARGMSVGLYAMFVSILVPSARKSWIILLVAAVGAL